MVRSETPVGRRRGGIRRHGNVWRARVSAGTDPTTGERIMLHETVPIPETRTKAVHERAERDAYKEAERALTRLQAEADMLKVARTKRPSARSWTAGWLSTRSTRGHAGLVAVIDVGLAHPQPHRLDPVAELLGKPPHRAVVTAKLGSKRADHPHCGGLLLPGVPARGRLAR
jgi:hypothetical protein